MTRGRPGGRPTLLTRATSKTICDGIRHGLYPSRAAAIAGISAPTLSRWLDLGEPGPHDPDYNEKYHTFRNKVAKAEADLAAKVLEQIEQHANKGDRKASEWIAEHRYGKEYGTQTKSDVELKGSIKTETVEQKIAKWKALMLEVPNESDKDE